MEYIQETEPIKVSGMVVASYGSDDPNLGCPVRWWQGALMGVVAVAGICTERRCAGPGGGGGVLSPSFLGTPHSI